LGPRAAGAAAGVALGRRRRGAAAGVALAGAGVGPRPA